MDHSLLGRWILRNKMLAVVHINPNGAEGDRVERYVGHTFDKDGLAMMIVEFGDVKPTICWNENGECVWFKHIPFVGLHNVGDFDLMESLEGKDWKESKIRIIGCEDCMEDKKK